MSVVELCSDHYGSLSQTNQRILHEMLRNRREDLWESARRIVIATAPVITVEMAVRRVRSSMDTSPPDPFTLYRAIRDALSTQERYLEHGRLPDY